MPNASRGVQNELRGSAAKILLKVSKSALKSQSSAHTLGSHTIEIQAETAIIRASRLT